MPVHWMLQAVQTNFQNTTSTTQEIVRVTQHLLKVTVGIQLPSVK